MRTIARAALVALALVFPGSAFAAVEAGQPFPTNLLTVDDAAQVTGLRVNLPKPSCTSRPSDCADIDVLNGLDGFNIQPRISIPFSAPIDLSTVSSRTIFLVGPKGNVIGINQVEWEPLTNTLHFESDEQLAEDTTYLLVVSRGVRGADGRPLDNTRFFRDLVVHTNDAHVKAYRHDLIRSLVRAAAGDVNPARIADASLFTTQSIDVTSRMIRDQLRGGAASFDL